MSENNKNWVIKEASPKTFIERAKREVPHFAGHFARFEEQTVILKP